MTGTPGRVVVGRLGRPHGVAGALHARATGPTLATLAVGERVWVRVAGAEREHAIAERAGAPDRLRLRFDGVASRDDAQSLAGCELLVDAGRIAPISEPDTFFVTDLVGCAVFAGDGRIGRVREVHAGPANDALEVEGADASVLVPFTADAVIELDVPGRRIVIRPDLLG